MSNISIIFKIDSKSSNYLFEGNGSINKDIVSFKDNESEYYIDFGFKKITKITSKESVVVDLKKSCIELKLDKLNTKLDIKVIKYKKGDNALSIKYKLDEEVNVLLEWSMYEYV